MYYKRPKYSNQKVTIDGEHFDSKKEARRWRELTLLQTAGEIKELRRQVKFELIPTQMIDGKVVERKCSYIADFVYRDGKTDKLVVEDVKGIRTTEYIIKRKLMLRNYDIKIKET